MTDQVLIPIEGSPLSEAALEYALAAFPQEDLTLLHVAGSWPTKYGTTSKDPYQLFEALNEVVADHEGAVSSRTVVGRPARAIVKYVEEHEIDELVIGSHGRELGSRILFGSVAETVARRSPVPTTIIRTHQREGGPRLLVPIDASSQSTKALQYALETFPDAEITVLHAIDPFETRYGDGQLVHTEEEYEQILKETKRLYTKATNLADEFGVEITTATAVEPVPRLPATAILSYVDEGKTDHVIMGSHGRSGVSRVLLGSVAETVARRSQVPVTIVR